MTPSTFRAALDRFQSRPPVCGSCGGALDNHGACWDCEEAAVIPRPKHDVASLRVRYYAALFAELAEEPCTPERATLRARTNRIAQMLRAASRGRWA